MKEAQLVNVLDLLSYITTNARVKKRMFKKTTQPIEINETNILEGPIKGMELLKQCF